MSKYIMALDSGTTSNRCILFDAQGEICSVAQKEFTQIFPKPGWVEHDADEIFSTQLEVAKQALANIGATAADIAAIGITNQRETTIVWNKVSGQPVCNAIVWQCRRTAPYCDQLAAQGLVDTIRSKTGLVIDPYFSATKIRWILQNVPGAKEQAQAGELLFGTVETWLIWKLTGGRIHVTDYSNASRTMLFNINTLQWDQEILDLMEIPVSMLPTPAPSSQVYGRTDAQYFGAPIPIAGAAGDQQAALFGQACFASGDAKVTYGTGAFLLMNTGKQPIFSRNGLVTTIAWGLDGEVYYALEGSIFVAGAAIQWLRDELRFIESAADSEYMAQKVRDTNGCYVRLHRPRCSLLGCICPWSDYGSDQRCKQVSYHPGDPGFHCIPNQRCPGRHGSRFQDPPVCAESRRRGLLQQLPGSNPGRYQFRTGSPPPLCGNHRNGRRLPGWPGRKLLERHRRDLPELVC